MTLIDDVVGKKLPTGNKLQAKVGAGSVKKKLYSATRSGVLKNLADNQDALVAIASKREADIRAGKYGRDKRMKDYRDLLKDKTLSKDDKRDIKAVLEHWSKGDIKKPTPEVKQPSVKAQRAKKARNRFRPAPKFDSKGVMDNPLSRQPYSPSAGSGGLGGTKPASKPSTRSFRPIRLK